MGLRFAFLVLEEHPYGQIMLARLLEQGHLPGLILQESSDVADIEREKFLLRMRGQPLAQPISRVLAGTKTPMYTVENHNDPVCQELLREYQPDLTVLGGTRIIKKPLMDIPARGMINSHPGLLPRLRGSASVGWALYKDLPVGATVHFIDHGIDTGDIILRQELKVYRTDTYESLNYRVACLAGSLMAEALTGFKENRFARQPQSREEGETLRVIPDDLLAEGIERLVQGRYSHFSD
jgi:methionyl-tRNA formyltransferase